MTSVAEHTKEPERRRLYGPGAGGRTRRLPPLEFWMVSPAVVVLAVLSLVPLAYIVWMSFSEVSLIGALEFAWVGLANWAQLATDGTLHHAWLLEGVYFVATVGVEMMLGIGIALLLFELTRGRNAVLSVILMPMFMAPVVVGLLGRFLVNPTYGLYSWVLDTTGIYSGNILGERVPAFAAVVLMDVWEWTPLITLITLAGLVSMPRDALEAAAVDGASYWQTFRYVTWPLVSGVVLVALLVRAMDAIRYFDVILVTTNGGPANATKIVPLYLYEEAFRHFDLGYAAVIGLTMLVVTIVLADFFVRQLRRRGLTT